MLIFVRQNTPLPPFLPLPKFILRCEISLNAKLLYGFLLNRTTLSQKNSWVNENGYVYIIYTIRQMAEDLDRSERTVKNALNELEGAGLIQRERQGWNQPNHIYLILPDMVQISAQPKGKKQRTDMQDSSPCMGQDVPTRNTDINKNDRKKTNREMLSPLGSYQNVFLSSEQLETLQRDFPGQAERYIEKLSSYMKQHGKHYASHEATIRKWISEDKQKQPIYDYQHAYQEGECL